MTQRPKNSQHTAMQKFAKVHSRLIPLDLNDVDTDLIIPAQFLTSVSRSGFGDSLFRRLRDSDPQFPLNLPAFKGASILIAASNFGCGSSREHAVWALRDWGIKVVIASSFADIFTGNSAKNGLLLITLPCADVDEMRRVAMTAGLEAEVDLETESVRTSDGKQFKFSYDPFRKHCLLNGLDDLDYILSRDAEIEKFREAQESTRFFSTKERHV